MGGKCIGEVKYMREWGNKMLAGCGLWMKADGEQVTGVPRTEDRKESGSTAGSCGRGCKAAQDHNSGMQGLGAHIGEAARLHVDVNPANALSES